MRLSFTIVVLLCTIVIVTNAQEKSLSLNIGDTVPPLRIRAWVQGDPVQKFEKGKIYVLEFWATWCRPCKAAIPHLSLLAGKYKDKVTILGIDSYEQKTTSLEKIKTFVDSMGQRMNYQVAMEDSNYMETDWFDASGERGIPHSFVVDRAGRLAWIGHPKGLDTVLNRLVNNTWDIKAVLNKRIFDKYLRELDDSLNYELTIYSGDDFKKDYIGKPDSCLLAINEMVRREPKLKYAPHIASNTFSALLKTNQHLAYEYGKKVIVTPTYDDPAYDLIAGSIEWYSDKFNISTEVYRLGAEAYQAQIDQIPYPETANMPKYYNGMAKFYWLAKNKSKAVAAQEKAIEALKSRKNFSGTDMVAFESRLRLYKKQASGKQVTH